MLISAGNTLEGYKILEYKDIVFGTSMPSEGAMYRQNALDKACKAAEALGANAIINMHMCITPSEVTVYANAVYVSPLEGSAAKQPNKVNLEAFIPKEKSSTAVASVQESNGYKFVVCPKCGTKYKTDLDENGHVHVKGFNDVDDIEPGLQIYCIRCGTKFTVPES